MNTLILSVALLQWLLPHELDIIARIFNVTIHFYAESTAQTEI